MSTSALFGFREPSDAQFEALWESGIFFLDANILLNLHRFPKTAAGDLLQVLGRIGPRLRIPFQTALEYERNRLEVLVEQRRRFQEIRGIVAEAVSALEGKLDGLQLHKRHASIDPNRFLTEIKKLSLEFQEHLSELEAAQDPLTLRDARSRQIDALIADRITAPPADQGVLNKIYGLGKTRYANRMPPGYMDQSKAGDKTEATGRYEFGGLVYEAQYGDLIVWEQVLAVCENEKPPSVAFVTDDQKEDWWRTTHAQGPKRFGPRPELRQEIFDRAGVPVFHIYSSDSLLRWAQKFWQDIPIGQQSAEQIRDVKELQGEIAQWADEGIRAGHGVRTWLMQSRPGARIELRTFPDFVVRDHDRQREGYAVKTASRALPISMWSSTVKRLAKQIRAGHLQRACLVVVCPPNLVPEAVQRLTIRPASTWNGVTCVVGSIGSDAGVPIFVPVSSINTSG